MHGKMQKGGDVPAPEEKSVNRTAESGFSMIELMVACFAAAILGLVVGSILVMMSSNMTLLGVGNRSDSIGIVNLQREAEVAVVALNAALRGASFSNTVNNNTPGNSLAVYSNSVDVAGTFSASGSNLLYSRPGMPTMTLVTNRLASFSWTHDSTNKIQLTLVLQGHDLTMTNNETVRVRNR